MTIPALSGLLETALYVSDPERSEAFYARVFGFAPIMRLERLIAMAIPDGRVLLLFRKGGTSDTDGDGQLHVAFSIPRESLGDWERWLGENGLPIESRREWDRGGVSLYFRDPDGHLVEVATPGVWSVY